METSEIATLEKPGLPQVASMDIATARAELVRNEWKLVQAVLRLIQDNDHLQQVVNSFALSRDISKDAAQYQQLEAGLWPLISRSPELANQAEARLKGLIQAAYDELLGVSVLGPFWRDDEITEILVDSWDSITIERQGVLRTTGLTFRDRDHATSVARQMALLVSDRALNPRHPLVTSELPGARVTFAIDSIVRSGLSISIRKFAPLMGMVDLLDRRALSSDMRDFLSACVRARANIVVSGGTGTGKTTFINALSEFIPENERVITIEDAYELTLKNQHWVALQTKEASSADDQVRVEMADLLVGTLRMRPDRVIVGEIREPVGATVMLQAANTGHDGTMTTVHANSAARALNFRMVGMARTGGDMPSEVAAAEVASAIDVVVQITREQGRRFVSEIVVVDSDDVAGSTIAPTRVFSGALVVDDDTGSRDTQFHQADLVPFGTVLAMKLHESGADRKWVARS